MSDAGARGPAAGARDAAGSTLPPRPGPGPERPYEFPDVHAERLANGLRLLVAPMPRLPIVTALALVDGGAVREPTGAEGVAVLTALALTEGAGGLDGAALAERLEGLGTSLVGSAEWDSSALRCTVTTSRLDEAFAWFAEVLRAPAFPGRDVLRLRDERLADLAQELAEPRGLADDRFDGFLFAPGARYARALGGTAASVGALDDAAVHAFHGSHYGPATTTVILVGDVTPDSARRLVEGRLGDWSGAPPVAAREAGARHAAGARARAGADVAGAARAALAPDAIGTPARRLVVVDKPGAPQSELRVGHAGVPRTHPDHLPIVVMNAILGGLFSSRINLNLRERHAYTYGASSVFDFRRGAGPFVVSTAVKSEVTARALEEIVGEVERMRAAPPGAEEVALATSYLAGVFPIRYETISAVASALAAATLYELPDDWFATYRARVRAVDAAAVHRAAQAYLDPAKLLALAVGDAATVAEPLAALGFAPVERYPAAHDPAAAAPVTGAPAAGDPTTRDRAEGP